MPAGLPLPGRLMLALVPAAVLVACPCLADLSSYDLSSTIAYSVGDEHFTALANGSHFGVNYGVGCGRHDFGHEPFCSLASGGTAWSSWCGDAWCWVAPSCTRTEAKPTTYFAGTAIDGLKFSYESCNSTDSFSDFLTDGEIFFCSVFELDSAGNICGNTNTRTD